MIKCVKKIIVLLFVIDIFFLMSCKVAERSKADYRSAEQKKYQKIFEAFDTECVITVYDVNNKSEMIKYVDLIIDRFMEYDEMFSKTNSASYIYKINNRNSDYVYVNKDVADLFDVSKQLYEWSKNLFDVSAGRLYGLWDVKNRKELPESSDINECLKYVGNYKFSIDDSDTTEDEDEIKMTFYNTTDIQYDFGALVKGYVCDKIKSMILEDGIIKSAIINLGGNVCCIGEMRDRKNKSFNIGIYRPFSENELIDKVEVIDKCVITSGIYQRYFKVEGDDNIYHHIINPKTGYPTNNDLDSVTIISKKGLLGDYLSTSSMLLGEQDAKILISQCREELDDSIMAIFVHSDLSITKY